MKCSENIEENVREMKDMIEESSKSDKKDIIELDHSNIAMSFEKDDLRLIQKALE